MPLPVWLAGFLLTLLYKTVDSAIDELKSWMWKNRKALVVKAAKRSLGIDETDLLDFTQDDFSVDEATITKVVNEKMGLKSAIGIEFTNIFSREAIMLDLNKLGLGRLNNILGASDDNPIITSFNKDSLRANIRGFMGAQAMEAVTNGSSRIIDSDGANRIVAAAMTYERNYEQYKAEPAKPLIMTPAAISNRERQARYRAAHTRHWEPR